MEGKGEREGVHHPCSTSSLAKAAAPERASTELGADFHRLLPPSLHVVQSNSIRNSRPNNVVHKHLAESTVCLKETRSQSSDSVELLEIMVVFGVLEAVFGFELRFRPALGGTISPTSSSSSLSLVSSNRVSSETMIRIRCTQTRFLGRTLER